MAKYDMIITDKLHIVLLASTYASWWGTGILIQTLCNAYYTFLCI